MKRFLALFLILALFCISPLKAVVEDGTLIPQTTLQPLAQWVGQAMRVQMRNLPIGVASGMRLKFTLGLQGAQRARSVAAYVPGQIIINHVMWDPDSVKSRSYLVHELVHHAQALSRRPYPCQAAKEREAYYFQNLWLKEQGEDPIVNDFWIDNKSACH
jgi:hypothetical protein